MSGPLTGTRVVDFSRVLAGPLCARTLLDLGAEVIKIEPPRPDVSRFAFPSTPGMSGYYAQQNAGKRNVSVDLDVRGARDLALRLCDTADVVVAHGDFLDLVNDGRLAHLGQPPLTAAVQAAQQRPLAGAQAWERRVVVDQSPLVAATLACWAFCRWEELATPGVWQV